MPRSPMNIVASLIIMAIVMLAVGALTGQDLTDLAIILIVAGILIQILGLGRRIPF